MDSNAEPIAKKRHSSSNDSPAEKRPHHELVSLLTLVEHPHGLAQAAIDALSWDLVLGMLPDYLKSQPKGMVMKLVAQELEGMSNQRITSILEGHEISSSSSSESEESEDERSEGENDRRDEEEPPRRNNEVRVSIRSRSSSPEGSSRRSSEASGGESPLIELYE